MSKKFRIDRRQLIKAVEPQMRKIAEDLTRDYDEMRTRLEGQPIEKIKAELIRYHEANGGDISEPELSAYAEQLQEGGRIVFEYNGKTVGWNR